MWHPLGSLQGNYRGFDRRELKHGSGQHKDMPDYIVKRQPFHQMKNDAEGINNPAREKQLHRTRRDGG